MHGLFGQALRTVSVPTVLARCVLFRWADAFLSKIFIHDGIGLVSCNFVSQDNFV